MRICTKVKSFALVLAAMSGFQANVEAASFTETFDNDADFVSGATLPDGWLTTGANGFQFKRYQATDFGSAAHSGDYVVGTLSNGNDMNRNEQLYTKKLSLKAGKEYTVSYWLKAPGGANPSYYYTQVIAKMGKTQDGTGAVTLGETPKGTVYADWTEISYKFTPETDGDYYLSFTLATMLYQSGFVLMDDISVVDPDDAQGGGSEPGGGEEGGDQGEKVELVNVDFDNNADFPDGAVNPEGWLSTGSNKGFEFKRYKASDLGISSHSGGYVYGTTPISWVYQRDEKVYTKMMPMKAGKEYEVIFWYYAPGGANPNMYYSQLETKVATSQAEDGIKATLGATAEKTAYADWTQFTYKFTPETDGDYCFVFCLNTQLNNAGTVAIDDVVISGPEEQGGGDQPGGGEGGDQEEKVELVNVDFDNNADFPDGAVNPEGWVSTGSTNGFEFKRYKASDLGISSHSGGYVYGTTSVSWVYQRDEKVYTKMMPMKAGKEYEVSFWYYAPGGANANMYYSQLETKVATSQTVDGIKSSLGATAEKTAYADWTQFTYKYTPEADGDYCFVFCLNTQLNNAGTVAIDDVVISGPEEQGGGDEPDVDDEDKEAAELPYSQSFDNENKDYDGTGLMPKGWLSTGSAPFVTANIDAIPAYDGTYYAIAPESNIGRDDRLYTPYFLMEKGKKYTVTFWLNMPGDGENASDFAFTVGREQDAEFHTPLLELAEYTNTGWKQFSVNYTPEKTAKYCFSFALGGETPYAGEVAIDLFSITAPGLIYKPKANFSYDSFMNYMNSNNVVWEGSTIKMTDLSTDADTYKWEVQGAQPETSEEQNPSFSFPQSGKYDVTLTVTNVKGSSTMSKTIQVQKVEGELANTPLANFDSPEGKHISRDYIPYFEETSEYDYVTGFNHYYNRLAERFAMPEGHKYTINSVTYYLSLYQLTNGTTYLQETEKPFSLVVYGEKDGRPDTDNVLGRYDTTMKEFFGTMGLAKAEMRANAFPKPVEANGAFYISFEYADDMLLDPTDNQISRSWIGLEPFIHNSKNTTLYVQPKAAPAGSDIATDGKFYPIDVFGDDYKGMGMTMIVWMDVDKVPTSVAMTADGSIVFAARLDGNKLIVSGTKAGETITVCDTAGRVVAQQNAEETATTVDLGNAPAGIYVVSTPAGTQKFVKK